MGGTLVVSYSSTIFCEITKTIMWKKIYVVYPKKLDTQKEIMDYLEENGNVESFTSLEKAKAYKKEYGGWICAEKADEEVYKEIKEYTKEH